MASGDGTRDNCSLVAAGSIICAEGDLPGSSSSRTIASSAAFFPLPYRLDMIKKNLPSLLLSVAAYTMQIPSARCLF